MLIAYIYTFGHLFLCQFQFFSAFFDSLSDQAVIQYHANPSRMPSYREGFAQLIILKQETIS